MRRVFCALVLALNNICAVDAGILVHFDTNDHYYELVWPTGSNAITWTDAKAAAEAKDGYLATVTSAEEHAFLETNFASQLTDPAPGMPDSLWIGLSDAETEGVFKWVTGEALSYSCWGSGEPNGIGDEDYVHYRNVPLTGGFRWNDDKLSAANADIGRHVGYIVEYNSIPEPSSIVLTVIGIMSLILWWRRFA